MQDNVKLPVEDHYGSRLPAEEKLDSLDYSNMRHLNDAMFETKQGDLIVDLSPAHIKRP